MLVLAPPDLDMPIDDCLDRKALTTIATAFHWQAELDSGKYRTRMHMAQSKGINRRAMQRQLRLVYLDPYIIRRLLDGRQPSGFSIYRVMETLPLNWEEQRKAYGFTSSSYHQTNRRNN